MACVCERSCIYRIQRDANVALGVEALARALLMFDEKM
jgi:hypothetical protein